MRGYSRIPIALLNPIPRGKALAIEQVASCPCCTMLLLGGKMYQEISESIMFFVYLFIGVIVIDYFLNPPKQEGE